MRAISPHANYSIQIVEARTKKGVDRTGVIQEVIEQNPVLLQFEHFAITPEEEAAALKAFNFSGIPEGVNPLTTLGVWDSLIYQRSQGLSDEERIEVEKTLREKGEQQSWARFIIVDAPHAPKPWPTYDEDSEDDVVAIAQRLELVDAVVAYEQENGQRPEVLEPLGATVEDEKPIEVSV